MVDSDLLVMWGQEEKRDCSHSVCGSRDQIKGWDRESDGWDQGS